MVLMFGIQSVTFWYLKSFPQSPTLVRNPTSPNLVSSTTSYPYIPLFITLGGEGRGGSARPPRPSSLTHDDLA